MALVSITEALTINTDHISTVHYLTHNTTTSKTNHASKTIQAIVTQAQELNRYYDFTNKRDRLKAVIILSNGSVYGVSFTRDKLDPILHGKNSKTRAKKY